MQQALADGALTIFPAKNAAAPWLSLLPVFDPFAFAVGEKHVPRGSRDLAPGKRSFRVLPEEQKRMDTVNALGTCLASRRGGKQGRVARGGTLHFPKNEDSNFSS